MPATLLPPSIELDLEPRRSDGNGGFGGGPADPGRELHILELDPERPATPPGAYRMVALLAIAWIVALFATIILVLEWRWVGSKDWVSIPLPSVFYLTTTFLLASSATMEFARSSLRAGKNARCTRWMILTLSVGFAFLAGQLFAWRDLAARDLHFASSPGSLFLYLITGAHGLHLLVAIVLLASVAIFLTHPAPKARRQAALDTAALFWHFIDGLWICLLAVLFATIQK